MKKFTIILTILIVMTIKINAQWTELTSGTTENLESVHFIDADTGFVTGTSILKTIDGGTNWTNLYTSPLNYALRSVYFPNSNIGYVVKANGEIIKTTDGGTNWVVIYQRSGPPIDFRSVYFTDANTGCAVGSGGTIIKTIDGGMNWTAQTSGTTNILYSVYFTDANTGCAVGSGGTIIKTIDGGTNWTAQTSGTTFDLYSVCFPDANTGYICGGNNSGVGIILKTTDGGTNWTINWTPTSGNHYPYSIYFSSINTGYAVGLLGDSGMILKTIDGGTNWIIQYIVIPADCNHNLQSVYCINDTTAYAVGSSGIILKTTNGGATGISQNIVEKYINVYPNPFNPNTTIEYELQANSNVQIDIYDILGRHIKNIADHYVSKGYNKIELDGSNLTSGVYFISFRAYNHFECKKILVVK